MKTPEFNTANLSVRFDGGGDVYMEGYLKSVDDLRGLHKWLGTLLEPAEGS